MRDAIWVDSVGQAEAFRAATLLRLAGQLEGARPGHDRRPAGFE